MASPASHSRDSRSNPPIFWIINIEIADESSSIFWTQDGSKGFSLDCLDLWSLRHSLVLSAVGQLAVRTLQRRGKWLDRPASQKPLISGWIVIAI